MLSSKPQQGKVRGNRSSCMTIKTIGLLGVLLCSPALTTTMAAAPDTTGQKSDVVTGTLQELDLSKMSGKIKSDLGPTVAFTIENPDLFKGLSVGEHVAIRIDDKGQAIKVMATILPELPAPELPVPEK
jgi:hypothetical protein